MSKVVGDYQLKEKIGRGSYADVYKGVNRLTGCKYAVKAIAKDKLIDPKLLLGLESEIRIMREFRHENIVQMNEYFSTERNFYLVLELCLGGDLNRYIRKNGRLEERVAINFLQQLASGLSFLQEKNFIHRDLKPANVLLNEFSENAILKLADFGFARHLEESSMAQTRCGTPLYMVILYYLIF
jgi:serine/threonine-protein kinase ULK/ATG1